MMKMNISERLAALRQAMKKHSVDMYYIPTDDFHGSEYVGEYFRSREYISGFTGSAGIVIVTQDYAGLWTDGRYFIQAEEELRGTEFVLNKSGCEGVLKPDEFIEKNIGDGVLGFDGRVVGNIFAEKLLKKLGKEKIVPDLDLISEIWEDRPPMPFSKAFFLEERYSGESADSKLERLRGFMEEKKADILVLTALDDICWTLNIRGGDVEYNPVILSFLVIDKESVLLFADGKKLEALPENALSAVKIFPYEDLYGYIANIPAGKTVYLDRRANYGVTAALPGSVKKISGDSPAMLFKAVKNQTESDNIKIAHMNDGVALTKFIYRMKTEPEKYTELSAAALIKELRSKKPGYISESFEPIIAYREHGAIVHYSPSEKTDVPLARDGFLLCDTGGHYLTGTTDVTRTICLGDPTDEMKKHYTAVLRGNLALGAAVFPKGSRGVNLDALARQPLWEQMLDYDHGTGHGVGYLLNVHEGPNSVRCRLSDDIRAAGCVFEEGMVTSNEPGLYIEGKYGIRTENLVLCSSAGENEFGKFLRFETLTLAPYDPDAVEPSLMTAREIQLYNEYQQRVYHSLADLLTLEEAIWLRNETREIS